MIATLVLFALVIVATFTDLWKHKIYNWTTYTGIVAAVLLSGIASLAGGTDVAAIGFSQSLSGLAICGAVMLICFVLFQIGGGDVKLIAMTGAFVGPEFGIEVLLWTFVLGGAVAVAILIWKCGAITLAQNVLQQIFARLHVGNFQPLTEQQQTQLQMKLYLAPCALLALSIVFFSSGTTLMTS